MIAPIFGENPLTGLDEQVLLAPSSRTIAVSSDLQLARQIGQYYHLSGKSTLASSATAYFLAVIPAGVNVEVGVLSVTASGGPMDLTLYEAPTVSAAGTPMSPVNTNRNYSGSDIAVSSNPTVSSAGTQLTYNLLDATNKVGGVGISGFSGFCLRDSESYLFKIVNNSSQTETVGFTFEWIERQ